jgi:hypothetical protein
LLDLSGKYGASAGSLNQTTVAMAYTYKPLDVSFWHKADMPFALTNVRFWGIADMTRT